ncbi:MAG: hypothetical protein ACLTSX_00455 [Collinsella sp.]
MLGEATTALFRGIAAKVGRHRRRRFRRLSGRILATVLCIYLTSAALSLVQGWLMTGVTQRVCYRMRREIIEKIDRMPLGRTSSAVEHGRRDEPRYATTSTRSASRSARASTQLMIASVAQLDRA